MNRKFVIDADKNLRCKDKCLIVDKDDNLGIYLLEMKALIFRPFWLERTAILKILK